MEDNAEDLTIAYMLGKYDGRKEGQAANRRCSDSAGYVLVNRLRNGGKEWKDVAVFSTQEEANRFRDILEDKDTKYTYNTKPRSLT